MTTAELATLITGIPVIAAAITSSIVAVIMALKSNAKSDATAEALKAHTDDTHTS